MNNPKDTGPTNVILAKYRELAIMHEKHTFGGDAKKTNLAYDGLHEVLSELVADKIDDLLFSVYEDGNRSVQLWAAAHTLELDEQRAVSKLRELSALELPIVSMSAHYTISEWKKGLLRFRAK